MTLRNAVAHRNLLYLLTLKELRTRYRKSVLGWTWSLLEPAEPDGDLQLRVPRGLQTADHRSAIPSGLESFPLYFLAGLLPFQFFSISVTTSMGVVDGNASLIKKVAFPHEHLVFSVVLAQVITLAIELGVLSIALVIAGASVLPWIFVAGPADRSAHALHDRGGPGVVGRQRVLPGHQLPVGHRRSALFYATPIIYTPDFIEVDALRWLTTWGPTGSFVRAFHEVLYDNRMPRPERWVNSRRVLRRAASRSDPGSSVDCRHGSPRRCDDTHPLSPSTTSPRRSRSTTNARTRSSSTWRPEAGTDTRSSTRSATSRSRCLEGEAFGVIGHNGSGKSTLLKCMAGILRPNVGQHQRATVACRPCSNSAPASTRSCPGATTCSSTPRSSGWPDRRSHDVSTRSSTSRGSSSSSTHRSRTYSSGMYVRLAFAVAINVDPEMLLIDEILAVGDVTFQQKCMEKFVQFRDEGRTLVLVTHDLSSIRNFCDRAIWLDHGRSRARARRRELVDRYTESMLSRELRGTARRGARRGSGEIRIERVDMLVDDRQRAGCRPATR